MKKSTIYLITTAAALLFAGCNQDLDSDTIPQGTEPIRFGASGTPSSRTIVDSDTDRSLMITWTDTDEVGIYGVAAGRSIGDNVAYIATPDKADASRCTFSAKESLSMFKWISNTEQGYYAYYPHNAMDGLFKATEHPVRLPAIQTQRAADSPAHIAQYGFMTAQPVQIAATAKNQGINFQFANIFSIVELRLKMTSDCPIASVPIKQVKIVSQAAMLSLEQGTIDLTRAVTVEDYPVSVISGDKSVSTVFEANPGLSKSQYASVYLIALPGTHPAGSLQLEITAIDNSVNTIALPEAVTLTPNRHYTRTFELSINDFQQANPFDVEFPTLSCKQTEPLSINLKGIADKIDFWSGEQSHDYAYSNQDRIQEPMMSVNFWSLLQNGYQRTPAKVKYSTDFNGTMDETNILSATWTDVTSQFTIPTHLVGVDDELTSVATVPPVSSGTVDCSSWFPQSNRSCYMAIFYHIDKYDANWVDPVKNMVTGNGRTFFYLHDMWVRAQYKSETTYSELYRHKYVKTETNPAYPTVVFGATYTNEDSASTRLSTYSYGTYPYVMRIGSTFTPKTSDKNAYIILPKITRPEAKNVGKDTPIVVMSEGGVQPETYQYTFSQAGVYQIAVVGTVQTLSGKKQIVKQATITVTAE